ncbi:carbohydrate-binding family 9-like protein [Pedobacter glucosidilyticus]|uniref:carbohydrate-binding family 9-like protein n=1 Tax=Pedobacter glucosidilyticus TaxID=1122941 RepID=UPI000420B7EE|nr:carbohydrate-binding family 9-like protein [Pedobacter glucosidilyticus]
MSKKINISEVQHINFLSDISLVSSVLNQQKKHKINETFWPNVAYKGTCDVSVLYTADMLALRFEVQENDFLARYINPNEPVYEDSCVEFFLAFDDSGYYNFEFNSNRACLAQFGTNKHDRRFILAADLRKIKIQKSFRQNQNSELPYSWELTIMLPLTVFTHHQLKTLKGKCCKANFYKCGDDLKHPHFLCWNKVENHEPNFHLPAYFGELIFE